MELSAFLQNGWRVRIHKTNSVSLKGPNIWRKNEEKKIAFKLVLTLEEEIDFKYW